MHGVEDGWWNPYASRDTQEHAKMIVGHRGYHDKENGIGVGKDRLKSNRRLLRAKGYRRARRDDCRIASVLWK